MKRGLNIGSGERKFITCSEVEWCNVDKVSRPGEEPDLIADGARLPFPDNSADFYVLHHCLEHEGCGEGTGLIEEAYRVLKPGGSLLVFVPDLRELAFAWLNGRLTTQIYVTNLYGAFRGNDESRHRWGYDQKSLLEYLAKCCEWGEVKDFDWRTIPGADCARDFWIAHAEAVK